MRATAKSTHRLLECSDYVLVGPMSRLDHQRLTDMALVALEEVAACCHVRPVQRTRALALVLAYLASRRLDTATRGPFDQFWKAIGKTQANARWGNVNAALNGIYFAVCETRDLAITSAFERQARDGSSALDRLPTVV